MATERRRQVADPVVGFAETVVEFAVCPGGEVVAGVMPEDNDDGAVAGK